MDWQARQVLISLQRPVSTRRIAYAVAPEATKSTSGEKPTRT